MKKAILLFFIALGFITFCSAQKHSEKHFINNRHVFTLQTGVGLRFANEHDTLFAHAANQDYYKRVKRGTSIGFDYGYVFYKNLSVGLKSSAFAAFHADDRFRDDTYTFYIAPSLSISTPVIRQSVILYGSISCGYSYYRHNMNTSITTPAGKISKSTTLEKGSLGYGMEIGGNYYFNEILGIGLSVNYHGGQLNEINNPDGVAISLNPKEKISRLDVMVTMQVRL